MDNLQIIIEAILSLKDTTKSKQQIVSELPKLEGQLQSDKKARVSVIAGLDIAKSKNLIQSQLNTLANQAKAPTIKVGVDVGNLQSQFKNVISQSNNTTKQIIADEKKKQEAYKATADSVIYHAGVISKYNKAETNGRFYGSSRGTGYYGTGHYFVDSAHKSEIMGNSSFAKLPYTSVDISKYDNLFKANTDKIADELHTFLKNLTQYTQGLKSIDINSLFKDFQKVFMSATMNFEDFNRKVEALKSYMSTSSMSDRNDSVSTQFMKSLGYGGVDTRGTSYADTRYGTVIYDLKEESVLQANITNELQKQGQMLDKISYKTGEVFDKETDRQLAGKINASKLEAEAQAQYKKSFDSTNLTSAEKAYDNAVASLKNVNEQMVMYENHLVNAKKEAQNLAQEMKRYGITMSPEEIAQQENEIASEAKPKLEQLKAEKAMLEQTIPVLREKYETEQALANKALDDARKLVAQRQQEMQSIQAETNATNQLKTVQTQAQQTTNIVSNIANTSNLLDTFKKSLANMNLPSDQIDSIASRISNLNVEITSLNQSMSVNKLGNRMLSVDIAGTDKLGNAVKLTQRYNLETNELVRTIDTLSSATQKSSSQLDNLMAQQIKRRADLKNQVEQIYKSAIDPNASRSITNGQNLDTLKAKYNEIKLAIDGMDGKSKTAFAQQEADVSKLISDLKIVINQYKQAENVSTTLKPDKLASAISKAESQFQVLNTNIQNAGVSSDKLTQNIQTISSVLGKTQSGGVINKAEIEQVFTALSNARNELEALVKMKTSNSAIERVRIQAETLVSSLNTFANNNVGFDKFTTTVNGAVISVDSLKQSLATINSQSDLSIIRSQITALETAFKETAVDSGKYVTQINSAIIKLQGIANSAVFTKNASNPQVTQTKQDINSLITAYQNLATKLQGNITPAGLETVRTELTQLNARFNNATTAAKRFETELKNDNGAEKLAQKVALLTSRIKAYQSVNTKAVKKYGSEFQQMLSELSDPNIDDNAYNRINKYFQMLRQEINAAGLAGKDFFGKIKEQATKFASWMSLTGLITSAWHEVKKMVTNVIELDNCLLELSKVSDLSATGLKSITKEAYEMGKQVGKTGTDVINAVTNFKRAGFDLKESMSFAKDALVLTNVAEGITDTGEAATALISIMKGYGDTTAEFSQKILDSVNEVSNTQAINFDDLIDGSQRLSAVAKQAGVSFEQMLGILTGTNEVLQNIEKTASGQITIFTRLQGIQLPDEEDVMPVAKLQETINTATKGVVNIVDQTSGELRNVYDILNDINNVWDTLDKNTQEGIAFAAAGTRQKNVFLSMMENWKNVESATKSAQNSLGSSAIENQKYLDSISGKLANLESAFQSLSQTVVNSDLIKFLVDSGTNILNIIDEIIKNLGTIPTILTGIAAVGAFKNVGELLNTPVYAQPQFICA